MNGLFSAQNQLTLEVEGGMSFDENQEYKLRLLYQL